MEITPELLAGFLDEAPEYLDTLDTGLMEFEANAAGGVVSLASADDQERMNGMFRAAHSLKGLAAAFGFDRIKELTHRMETLFDQVRMGKRDLTSTSFETLFRVFDRLKTMVRELSDPAAQSVGIDDLLTALDEILNATSVGPPPASRAPDHARGTEMAGASPTVQPPVAAAASSSVSSSELPGIVSEVFADAELAAAFIETTVEAVEELNEGLLGLEKDAGDAELLNRAFRCAHNIKGASGAAGLKQMNRLTHEIETIFDLLRNRRIVLGDGLMNVVFSAVDQLRACLEQIRAGNVVDVAPDAVQNLLRDLGAAGGRPSADPQSKPTIRSAPPSPPRGGDGGDGGRGGAWRITVRFPDGFTEAPIHAYLIHNKLADLGEVLGTDPDIDAMAGDTVLTSVTFRAQLEAEPSALRQVLLSYGAMEVEVARDGHDVTVIEGALASVGEVGSTAATSDAMACDSRESEPCAGDERPDAARAPVDRLAPVPTSSQRAGVTGGPPASSADTSPRPPASPTPGRPESPRSAAPTTKPARPSAAAASAPKLESAAQKPGETLRVDQERLDQLMNLGGELVINRARFAQVNGKLRGLLSEKNYSNLVGGMEDRLRQMSQALDARHENDREFPDAELLRSQLTHLDLGLQAVRSLVEQVHDARAAMVDFDEALHALGRVSDGLQKGIMGTRMVPIGPLFGRFRRVVRDISKANGKQVELVLIGENTELDKRMIDELGDPLTHMVRNSVDHGLEMPDVRVAAGKNPVGTVTLDAHHRGNSICIEVRDDGAGIHLDRVKNKVLEKGLATAEQVQKMSDRELIQYILKPGFSTAPVVTDLSGRGMGMDIVVNKLEKLNGTMEIDSTPGEGTCITMRLPLTIAILTSMVARIGRGIYAMPLENVAEIITVRRGDIQRVQRREAVRVRERIVPVVYFEDVFGTSLAGLQTETRQQDELTLMLAGFEDQRVGLVVDELLGQEDIVIKSVAENYRDVRGIAGASIRGDGSVSLILDVAALVALAGKINADRRVGERPATAAPPVLAGA